MASHHSQCFTCLREFKSITLQKYGGICGRCHKIQAPQRIQAIRDVVEKTVPRKICVACYKDINLLDTRLCDDCSGKTKIYELEEKLKTMEEQNQKDREMFVREFVTKQMME